jgi:hypothetical protein
MFVFGTAIALATDHWPAPARGRPISTSSKMASMSPFYGTNPIHVTWNWLDPRILVLAVEARGPASSRPRTRRQRAVSVGRILCAHTLIVTDTSASAAGDAGQHP